MRRDRECFSAALAPASITSITGTSPAHSRTTSSATAAMVLHATISILTLRCIRKRTISAEKRRMVSTDFTPYGTRAVSPKYTTSSNGRRSIKARTTVRPPTPESKTPMGPERSAINTLLCRRSKAGDFSLRAVAAPTQRVRAPFLKDHPHAFRAPPPPPAWSAHCPAPPRGCAANAQNRCDEWHCLRSALEIRFRTTQTAPPDSPDRVDYGAKNQAPAKRSA